MAERGAPTRFWTIRRSSMEFLSLCWKILTPAPEQKVRPSSLLTAAVWDWVKSMWIVCWLYIDHFWSLTWSCRRYWSLLRRHYWFMNASWLDFVCASGLIYDMSSGVKYVCWDRGCMCDARVNLGSSAVNKHLHDETAMEVGRKNNAAVYILLLNWISVMLSCCFFIFINRCCFFYFSPY